MPTTYLWTLDDGKTRYMTMILRDRTMIQVVGEGRETEIVRVPFGTTETAHRTALDFTRDAEREGMSLTHVYALAGDYLADEFALAALHFTDPANREMLHDVVNEIVNGMLRDGERLY